MTPGREHRSRRPREVRALTVHMGRCPKHVIDVGRRLYPEEYDRPRVRSECVNGPRPCVFVGCKHNLYLDVSARANGQTIKFNFPDLEPEQMADSCALDVADEGGRTLEDVGALLNVTRERVRQLQQSALTKVVLESPAFRELRHRGGR